jgi:mono/diheme cytochrome c family protein
MTMQTRLSRWFLASTIASVLLACGIAAERLPANEAPAQTRDLFEVHIRPTLVKHCITCHGEAKQEGGLQLTSLESMLAGGDSGPAITPGQPEESLLLEALRYESFEMPPGGQLDQSAVDGIAAWIEAGAVWPPGVVLAPTPKISQQDRDWWCYQPIADPVVPEVDDGGWCRNEIDHFIFKRLQGEGLSPAPQAEPARLARRVHFALTGLPPDEQTASLLEGERDDGWYELLVDRLLDNAAYGENQARYWLDLVRYADSDGYNADHPRPEAYHYRDYAIRSFNADKPYDRFVMEQLAGDEIDPGNRDALIGTMYLRHWIYEWNQRDVEGQWAEILSDITETTADVFLAQGLKCARCHDHKFDPLLQRDYYAFQAFFAGVQPREDLPIADVDTLTRHFEQQQIWEEATEQIRARLHEIETPALLAHASREGVDKFTKEIQGMIAARRCERSPYEHQIASLASNQFDLHPEKLAEWLDEQTEAERQELRRQLTEFDHLKPEPLPTLKFVASDVGPVAPPTIIPGTGDDSPVAPGFPEIISDGPADIPQLPTALQSTGRRTALARWITNPDNPLTARVIVNRVWQQHFGRGLAETCSDFGQLGTLPSHPELLDWLARRFMADGWSLKKLHRLILTSATYRQSSLRSMDEQLAKIDPQNVLLWRMNSRRLSGEEIHDAILAATGELSSDKRAVYKPVKRNQLDPLLAVFDFPDRVRSEGERHQTITSPQALLLMNDPWLHERAKVMAEQIGVTDVEALVPSATRRLYFRTATPRELDHARRFCDEYRADMPDTAENPPSPPPAYVALLHALLCSNETIYVD